MEFRSEKAAGLFMMLWLAPVLGAQQEFGYEVRHEHLRKGCTGTLRIDERGVSYQEISKKKKKHPHSWEWRYQDIQQLEIGPEEVRVLTYQDNQWKLGADREYRFRAPAGAGFERAYGLLKDRLDQRLVAALADSDVVPLWQIPAKRLGRISGSQGMLIVGRDRIAYRTEQKGESRTWRYNDIENISSSGPFQLTVTSYERARSHYGSLKGFNFQLKEPLSEDRYNDLWRRLNRQKGLKLLTLNSEQETKR